MKFSEDYATGVNVIRSYDDTSININNRRYTQSLVVSSNSLIDNWPIKQISQLNTTSLNPLLELQPEVIIIGTGSRLEFPSAQAYASIINQGIGIEFMDSAAACRTYNILISENRQVVAGIIICNNL
jgi:uncharacterized protein